MKLKDAIDLYKKCSHLDGNYVIILFPNKYKQNNFTYNMIKTRIPLKCIRWRTNKRKDLWYDKFSLFELTKDDWEICAINDWKGIRKGDPVLKVYVTFTDAFKKYARS